MRMMLYARALACCLAIGGGCIASSADDRKTPDDQKAATPPATPPATTPTPTTTQATTSDVRATANQVIAALATHDMSRVASLVHPARGVRFSPYPYVDTTSDRRVSAADVATLWSSASPARWGSFDGSGEPINLSYPAYHAKFVYDADFQHAPRVAVDSQPIGHGNATNNIADVYRGASVVEYHWPGRDPAMSGMDWRSLWLVFTHEQSRWYLVGIVHGAWTI